MGCPAGGLKGAAGGCSCCKGRGGGGGLLDDGGGEANSTAATHISWDHHHISVSRPSTRFCSLHRSFLDPNTHTHTHTHTHTTAPIGTSRLHPLPLGWGPIPCATRFIFWGPLCYIFFSWLTTPCHRARVAQCCESLSGHTVRCARATTDSHGSQGPEFCTLQLLLVHQGFFCLVPGGMLATGPSVLNSAPHAALN